MTPIEQKKLELISVGHGGLGSVDWEALAKYCLRKEISATIEELNNHCGTAGVAFDDAMERINELTAQLKELE